MQLLEEQSSDESLKICHREAKNEGSAFFIEAWIIYCTIQDKSQDEWCNNLFCQNHIERKL